MKQNRVSCGRFRTKRTEPSMACFCVPVQPSDMDGPSLSASPTVSNGQSKTLDQRSDHKVNVVYFLAVYAAGQDEMPSIKIGESSDYDKRLKQHRKSKFGVSIPVEELCVVRGLPSDEKTVLNYFKQHRVDGEVETFRAVPEIVDYIRWLRDQHFVWVPGDGQCSPICKLEHADAGRWIPSPERVKPAPKQLGLFSEYGPLRLPPRVVTADDFYTNERIIESARRVMGGIDMDPASHAIANAVVKADTFYTIADDGLSQEWRGRVWLNPPFSKWEHWVPKILSEWRSGRIQEMCVLCAARTLTAQYFAPLVRGTAAMCLTTGRIAFWGGRATDSPDDGHAVLYFGTNVRLFADEFREIGVTFRGLNS